MATLLTAVVHRNRIQPFEDQRALLWYKVETIRLANETLNLPTEGASDQMILVALILLYFNVGINLISIKYMAYIDKYRSEAETLKNTRYI